jgi:hypothetical protein
MQWGLRWHQLPLLALHVDAIWWLVQILHALLKKWHGLPRAFDHYFFYDIDIREEIML